MGGECIRKIPEHKQHSAVENWVYRNTVEPVLPWFAKHFSANAITGAGMAVGVGSLAAAYTGYYPCAALGTLLKTWLDYVDGPVARCTGTVSKVGDWLDHVSDWVFYVPMGILLFARISPRFRAVYTVLLGVIVLGFLVSFGCQEKYFNADKSSPSVAFTRCLCPSERVHTIVQRAELTDVTVSLFYFAVLMALSQKMPPVKQNEPRGAAEAGPQSREGARWRNV